MWQTSACLSSLMGSNDPMRPNEDTSEGSSNGSKDVTVVTQLAASIDEHCQNISGSHCCGCAMISGVNQGDKKPSLATRHQREKEKGGGGGLWAGRQASCPIPDMLLRECNCHAVAFNSAACSKSDTPATAPLRQGRRVVGVTPPRPMWADARSCLPCASQKDQTVCSGRSCQAGHN